MHSSPAAPVFSAHISASASWQRECRWSRSTISLPVNATTSRISSTAPTSSWCFGTSPTPSKSLARSTTCSTSPRPPARVDYLELPIQTLKVGSLGTHKALGLAKAKDARFLLASTSEIYGDPLVHPQPEDYWGNVNPIGPRGCLRRSQAVRRSDDHGLPSLPRGRDPDRPDLQHLRPTDAAERRPRRARFIEQALRGEPITVFGDGSQTRSFCYVADLVEGIYRLLHVRRGCCR